MRNKRLIIALTGAVVFGLIATLSVTHYLANAQAYTKNLGNVVVAKFPIALGSKVTAEQLTVVQMPNGSAPEGSFDSPDKLVGRVAIASIGVKEPVTKAKLAAEGVAGGLSAVIPEGFRGMTVKVDDVVGVSGFILPGSFVDVVAVINPVDQSGNPISKIVLQNIKVLANGSNIDQPQDGREASRVQAVTLQVTPDQAEKLALATNEGRLQLVMRNFGDQEDMQTRGANKRSLLTGDPIVFAPSPAAPKVEQPAPVQQINRPRVKITPHREEPRNIVQAAFPVSSVPPRQSIELFEGAKKRTVEFP